MLELNPQRLQEAIEVCPGVRAEGQLEIEGNALVCPLPAAVGDVCHFLVAAEQSIPGEVVGMNSGRAWLMPFESMDEVYGGMPMTHERRRRRVPVGEGVLGRILDGLGRPVDSPLPLTDIGWRLAVRQSPSAFQRARIREPFVTSQKSIDGFLTCGRGQRMGIFAGPGVGKSVLLGQIARNAAADVNVVALIGERGVELRPFVEDCLGREGLARSVVVLSTSDNLPLMRARAVETAVTIAHAFRQQGANVLFLLDSLTRLALAQRELGLQLGEPPSSRGFPPSAFQLMADTLELLGNDSRGSITAFATVLVEGDDLDEPISDTARALLDGHIVLSRSLAERGHFPAIDIAQSVSRHFNTVASAELRMAVRKLTGMLAVYTEVEDLIRIGAYVAGSDARVDKAVELLPLLNAFLQQDLDVSHTLESTCATLVDLASQWPH